MFDSSKLAPVIVDGVEALMKEVFPIAFEKSAFSVDELQGMKVFAYKQKMQQHKRETVIEESDNKYAAMCEEYEKFVSSLSFQLSKSNR